MQGGANASETGGLDARPGDLHALRGALDIVCRSHENNGFPLEDRVGRFFADCEAIYSCEGSREMNTLIVGRAITGESAFV